MGVSILFTPQFDFFLVSLNSKLKQYIKVDTVAISYVRIVPDIRLARVNFPPCPKEPVLGPGL